MSSRAPGLLYRHNASLRGDDVLPLVVLERDAALRARDLLRAGTPLDARVILNLSEGGPFESYNVIGGLPGRERPGEVVVVGAHLDSWDFGTGTLDNGANVVLLMDIARQMVRLGIETSRTIRFALWNGEEQGFYGSQGYVERHGDALDRHAVAMSFDIGCGHQRRHRRRRDPRLRQRCPSVLSSEPGGAGGDDRRHGHGGRHAQLQRLAGLAGRPPGARALTLRRSQC